MGIRWSASSPRRAPVAGLLGACATLVFAVCLTAPASWAQQPPPSPVQQPPSPVRQQRAESDDDETPRRQSPLLRIPNLGSTLGSTYPGLANYPLELFGLLMAPLERREINLVPAFAIGEEFNDNIFMNNDRKRYDFITSFTPSVILLANRPQFQLAAGFANVAEIFARDSSSNDAFSRQEFILGSFWQMSPHWSLSISDTFTRDQGPDALAGGFSVNGQGALSNFLSASVGWQMAPQTRLDVTGIYSVIRFEGNGSGIDSDTYGVLNTLSHGFTPRFTGMIGYNFTYLDLRSGHGDNATTHNPTIGFSYRITQNLSFNASGGPAFTSLGSEDFITPGVNAGLVYQLSFGTASIFYSRGVGVAGGFGGPTDTQSIAATLIMPTWRDLLVIFNPGWTQAESLSDRQIQRVDIDVVSLGLGAAYRVSRYITVFGGYTFLRQRVGSKSTTPDFDADQNRVKVGVQFGYPFAFDLGI
jgi:hypothetical protein